MTLPPGTVVRITAPMGDHTGHTATVLDDLADMWGFDIRAQIDTGERILLRADEVEVREG